MSDNVIKFPVRCTTESSDEVYDEDCRGIYCSIDELKYYCNCNLLIGAAMATGCIAVLLTLLNMYFKG